MILTDFDQDAYEEMLKEEALKQGRAEGHESGLKEGLKAGLERGKAEGLKTGQELGKTETLRIMAANMRKQGFSEEMILSCTGLTEEQLKTLEE